MHPPIFTPGSRVRAAIEQHGGCPTKLYKFRAQLPSPTVREWSYHRSAVRDGFVYFAKPTDLNDVFDCQPSVTVDVSPEETEAFLLDVVRSTTGIDAESFRANARRRSQDAGFWRTSWSNLVEWFGVCSLAATCEEQLMWAHYGGDHKGYALCFEGLDGTVASLNEDFVPVPVQYTTERFVIRASDFISGFRAGHFDLNDFWEMLCRKDMRWRYESEWRLIRLGGNQNVRPPVQILRGIVLGARCSEEDEAVLRGWARESGADIAFSRVRASSTSYSIERAP